MITSFATWAEDLRITPQCSTALAQAAQSIIDANPIMKQAEDSALMTGIVSFYHTTASD